MNIQRAIIGAIIGTRAERQARRAARQQARAERRAARQRPSRTSANPMRATPTRVGAYFVQVVTIENGHKTELIQELPFSTAGTVIADFKRNHWADDMNIANGRWPANRVKYRYLYQTTSTRPVLWATWDNQHPDPAVVQQQAQLRALRNPYAQR